MALDGGLQRAKHFLIAALLALCGTARGWHEHALMLRGAVIAAAPVTQYRCR